MPKVTSPAAFKVADDSDIRYWKRAKAEIVHCAFCVISAIAGGRVFVRVETRESQGSCSTKRVTSASVVAPREDEVDELETGWDVKDVQRDVLGDEE